MRGIALRFLPPRLCFLPHAETRRIRPRSELHFVEVGRARYSNSIVSHGLPWYWWPSAAFLAVRGLPGGSIGTKVASCWFAASILVPLAPHYNNHTAGRSPQASTIHRRRPRRHSSVTTGTGCLQPRCMRRPHYAPSQLEATAHQQPTASGSASGPGRSNKGRAGRRTSSRPPSRSPFSESRVVRPSQWSGRR